MTYTKFKQNHPPAYISDGLVFIDRPDLGQVAVYLDKQYMGRIKQSERGFYYVPKGRRDTQHRPLPPAFPSVEACKRSLLPY